MRHLITCLAGGNCYLFLTTFTMLITMLIAISRHFFKGWLSQKHRKTRKYPDILLLILSLKEEDQCWIRVVLPPFWWARPARPASGLAGSLSRWRALSWNCWSLMAVSPASWSMSTCPVKKAPGRRRPRCLGFAPFFSMCFSGVGKCPMTWVILDITWKSSHLVDH